MVTENSRELRQMSLTQSLRSWNRPLETEIRSPYPRRNISDLGMKDIPFDPPRNIGEWQPKQISILLVCLLVVPETVGMQASNPRGKGHPRYDRLDIFEDKDLRKLVPKERLVTMKKSDDVNPGLDTTICRSLGLCRPITLASCSWKNPENTLPSQVSPQFQGIKRRSRSPTNSSGTNVYNFIFHLPNTSNDNSQDRTDYFKETLSSHSHSQSSPRQARRDKNIDSRAKGSDWKIPTGVARAEETSINKWKNIGNLYLHKKRIIRKAPQVIPDPAPMRIRTAPVNPAYTVRKSRIADKVCLRPLRDRVIHLLALKDYKETELRIRLQRDGISDNDMKTFRDILQQVANLNPHDGSYSLKYFIFNEIQKDWPGYNELDKQALDFLYLYQNDREFYNQESSKDKHLNMARTQSSVKKKVRIVKLPASNNNKKKPSISLSPFTVTGKYTPSAPPKTYHLPRSNTRLPVNSNRNFYNTRKVSETQGPSTSSLSQNSNRCDSRLIDPISMETVNSISVSEDYVKPAGRRYLSNEQFEYEFTEQAANNQHYSSTDVPMEVADRQDGTATANLNKEEDGANSEFPDLYTDFPTIVSLEQYYHCKQKFQVIHNEYKDLYIRMLNLSMPFIHLESEKMIFSPDSREYYDINNRIFLEYQKMKIFMKKNTDVCIFTTS
ncbi:RNA polymerase II elongation factor ELL2-like [Ctenodactylus gundi]